MGRQDIIERIQTEMRSGAEHESGNQQTDTLCQYCGALMGSSGSKNDFDGEYVVHRVPSHGENGMKSVFYCSTGCFQDAMNDLLAGSDAGK